MPIVPPAHVDVTDDAGRGRRELRSLAPLVALSGFGIAQPVLDVLGRNPELVAFRGARSLDLWLVGLAFVAVPPLLLWLVELAVGAVAPAARPHLHRALLAVLGCAIGAQVAARALHLRGPALVAVVVAVGAVVLALVGRATVKLWLSYAAWAPLLFLVLFAATSPAADAAGGGTATIGGGSVTHPARVVVLVLDELPLAELVDGDGKIDADLYPGFASLAAGSRWYRNASAVSNATTYAVPAILTGKLPPDSARPLLADHPDNLFTLLGGAYRMEVNESVTRLCPRSLCRTSGVGRNPARALVADGTDVWEQQVRLKGPSDPLAAFAEPGAAGGDDAMAKAPGRFSRLIASLDGTPTRTLHLAHIVLPHTPSRYLPSGQRYPLPAGDLGPFWQEPGRFLDRWTDDEWPAAVARQRAILQTQYVDGLVGQLVRQLKVKHLWDDSLVVVTADHGRSFTPGSPARGFDPDLDLTPVLPDVMGVPLFIHLPGETGPVVDDRNVQTIDIVPTIADALGVTKPYETDGTSVLGDAPRPAEKVMHQRIFSDGLADEAGRTFTVPASGFLASVLRDRVDAFVGPRGPDRVERGGGGSTLIGTSVDRLTVGAPSSATAKLHAPHALDDVDPGGASVPVLLSGETDGRDTGEVLVAVNGVVAGVSPRFSWDGHGDVFEVLVPARLLVKGTNPVRLYAVHADRSLHRISVGGG